MSDDTEAPNQEPSETESDNSLSLLANNMFGQNYHGKQPEAVPETPPKETATEEVEAEAETTEETESSEESESKESDEPEYEEYELSHVAQMLGVEESDVDVDDDGKVVLQGKVDGESVRAPVKDLLSNYQMYQAADKRLEEAKSKRDALTKELNEKSEALQGQYATAAKLIENAEKLIDDESSNIDWKDLRENDPAEYSAKKTELQERKDRIERMKQEAYDEYKQNVEQQQSQSQQEYSQYIQQEQEQLLEKLPEWKDSEQAKAEKGKIVEYLKNEGFSDQDVQAASDHRLVLMARKAMLYDQQQAKTEPARKKVAKVPKVMKPGTPKSNEQVNNERLEKQRAKLKKSGKLDDAFELLRASKS